MLEPVIRRAAIIASVLVLGVGLPACGGDGSSQPAIDNACPNAFDGGIGVYQETCSADAQCACGLQCLEGACFPWDGDALQCGCAGGTLAPLPPNGLPVLGEGDHTVASVVVTEIGTASDGLSVPRDLEINPDEPDQLWVICRGNESMVIFEEVGTTEQTSRLVHSGGSAHFMAQPAAFAFGQPGTMASIHETDVQTQGPDGTPADFMGPTLFDTTLNMFDAGHGSHLDMLHNTPNGMGIAWEKDNVYWVFDGAHSSLTRYDFQADHGRGGADHSDGIVARHVSGQVSRVADVPSHMEVDRAGELLYVADTGNNRVCVLDITTGTESGGNIFPNYDSTIQTSYAGSDLWTLIDGEAEGWVRPSGLALHNDTLYITDNGTGRIYAYDLAGELIDWVDLELPDGALMGIEVVSEESMYVVDAVGDRVLHVAAE